MALTFNINNVICISVKSHNEQQLKAISEVYRISLESLIFVKEKGLAKIWIEIGGNFAIAGTTMDNDTIFICENFSPLTKKDITSLEKIKPIQTPKVPKVSWDSRFEKLKVSEKEVSEKVLEVILDVDIILDKISKQGIKSLVKEELDFLDNQ